MYYAYILHILSIKVPNNLTLFVLKDLVSALKGALSGSLEHLILGLMKSTAQYDASELKSSMKVCCIDL